MLRSILLGHEPTAVSLTAAELAQTWAVQFQATITALGIFDETISAPTAVPVGGGEYKQQRDQDLLERDRRAVQSGLDAIATRLDRAGVPHRILVRSGTPHEVILDEAQSCDVIILGKEAESDIGIGEPSSQILWEILQAAPRPVVAVPSPLPDGSGVLMAYDGRLPASRTLYALAASGLDRLGPVHVLCIDPRSAEQAAERAQRAVKYLAAHEIPATPLPVATQEDRPTVILAEAERLSVSLIAMGCLGSGLLRKLLTGSTTRQMLRESPYPLFLFH